LGASRSSPISEIRVFFFIKFMYKKNKSRLWTKKFEKSFEFFFVTNMKFRHIMSYIVSREKVMNVEQFGKKENLLYIKKIDQN
jgi:hypothetical protein